MFQSMKRTICRVALVLFAMQVPLSVVLSQRVHPIEKPPEPQHVKTVDPIKEPYKFTSEFPDSKYVSPFSARREGYYSSPRYLEDTAPSVAGGIFETASAPGIYIFEISDGKIKYITRDSLRATDPKERIVQSGIEEAKRKAHGNVYVPLRSLRTGWLDGVDLTGITITAVEGKRLLPARQIMTGPGPQFDDFTDISAGQTRYDYHRTIKRGEWVVQCTPSGPPVFASPTALLQPDFNDNVDAIPLRTADIRLLSLSVNSATERKIEELIQPAVRIRMGLSRDDRPTNDIQETSKQALRRRLSPYTRKTVFVLGHLNKWGNFETRNIRGQSIFSISLQEVVSIAKECNVNVFLLGCESAKVSGGPGVLDTFNSVIAVERFARALRSRTYGQFLGAFASPTLSLVIDQTLIDAIRQSVEMSIFIEARDKRSLISGQIGVLQISRVITSEGKSVNANGNSSKSKSLSNNEDHQTNGNQNSSAGGDPDSPVKVGIWGEWKEVLVSSFFFFVFLSLLSWLFGEFESSIKSGR